MEPSKHSLPEDANISEMKDETFHIMDEVLDETPIRMAGSVEGKKAAENLYQMYEERIKNGKVTMDEFFVHPMALLQFFKIVSVIYTICFIMLLIGDFLLPYVLVIYYSAMVYSFSQFVFYKTYFDWVHKKKKGYNVHVKLEPEEEVKQQIIVTGHHDTPFIFNYIEPLKWQKYYAVRISLGLIPAFAVLFYITYWAIAKYQFGQDPILKMAFLVFMGVGLIFVLPFFKFLSSEGSPGAGDNLVSTAMTVVLTEYFGGNKKLKNTRVILGTMDAEESGLRGAMAFTEKYQDLIDEVPTYALILDGIYQTEDLQFLSYDINGFLPLSKKMARECSEVAEDLGLDIPAIRMPFGGGGTDAAAFQRAGAKSTCLIGIASDLIREDLHYHTSRDTPDKIDPEAVEDALEIVISYILKKDNQYNRQNELN